MIRSPRYADAVQTYGSRIPTPPWRHATCTARGPAEATN